MNLVNSEIISAASDFNLTTLAAVKMEFDITTTDQDAYLESLISRVSGAISSYCRRVFARQTYQDTFVAYHRHQQNWLRGTAWVIPWGARGALFLANRPVISGSLTVMRDGHTLVEGQDYRLFRDMGKVDALNGIGQEVVVTYDAGWVLPGWPDTGGSTLPAEVTGAAIMLILGMRQSGRLAYTDRDPFLRTETVDGVGSRTYSQQAIGSATGSSTTGPGMISGPIADALAPYVIPVGA